MAEVNDRFFDYDEDLGILETFHYDPATDTFVIKAVQDVGDIVETNKAVYNSFDERANWKGEWHQVASMPLVVAQDLMQRGIFADTKELEKWLADPDNRFFRTRPGRL